MDPNSGRILAPEDMTEQQKEQIKRMEDLTHKLTRRSLIPIPEDELSKVQQLSLKERRKWANKKKKDQRQARRQARRHQRR
jgi:hypothetical protein